ncbi:MAG: site-2 protease family protein [Clostridiales bacterium]|nr:site-2 protease family protein [Clostridiales bacterium]
MIHILDAFINSLGGFLTAIPGVIIAVTLHEYTKSLVAHKLGDTGIKAQGRLAPNPLKHMDILGSIFLVFFSYGWASPVRLGAFSVEARRKAMLLIFVMPFLVNIIIGMFFSVGANFFSISLAPGLLGTMSAQTLIIIGDILFFAAFYNISFALFSLIPVYPLNGTHLLWAIKPAWAVKVSQYEGILKLVLVFFIILTFASQIFTPLTLRVILAFSF